MNKAKIMLVEDEVIVASDLIQTLTEIGYQVCAHAATGADAIRMAASEQPDLILMDIVLSGAMDGIEAAKLIRERFRIPIIYLTAYGNDDIMNRAKITEPFGYLLKPFDQRELQIAIEIGLYKAAMEENLLRAKKLESVGLLAGGIAHDFNNLLTIILGYIEIAKEESHQDSVIRKLEEAVTACLKGKELTNRLVTFSRGGTPVKKIGDIAELICDACRFALAGSNVKSNFFFPNDLWPVEFDEYQIRHAFSNIILNAVEAMPQGGVLDIRADNVVDSDNTIPTTARPKHNYVKISIRDHGIGISKENLSRIFDPYFSTKEMGSQKGMGLGLSIADSIVSKHNGCITVESERGKGTVFHIWLPASLKQPPAPEQNRSADSFKADIQSSAGNRKQRILVMDDETIVREFIEQMLGCLGYAVMGVEDGHQAIDIYQQSLESGEPFDAVILDLTVRGGMGGREVIQKLKALNPEVKAVISSGYYNDPVMENFKLYGFCGAIAKPYQTKELKLLLEDIL